MIEYLKKIYSRIFKDNQNENRELVQNISENPHFAREKQVEKLIKMSNSENEEEAAIGTRGIVILCESRPDLTESYAEEILDSLIENMKRNTDIMSDSIIIFKCLPIPENKAEYYAEKLIEKTKEENLDKEMVPAFLICLNEIADEFPELMQKYDYKISEMMVSDNFILRNTALLVVSTTLRQKPKSMENCRDNLDKIIKNEDKLVSEIGIETYEWLVEIDKNLVGNIEEEVLEKAKSKSKNNFSVKLD